MNQSQIRHACEILILGYMCGVVTMPGANYQFQFWFISLVPVMIEMIGLPSWCTFWIYAMFYPINQQAVAIKCQHIFILCLVAWLVTIGPERDIVRKCF